MARRNPASLLRNTQGNALVIIGLSLPLLIGAVGLGVDTIQLALTKRQLQREADSGALAGAFSVFQHQAASTSQRQSYAKSEATEAIGMNSMVPLTGTPMVTLGAYTNPARTTFQETVRVALVATRRMPFMALFTHNSTVINAEARAAVMNDGEFCMLALANTNVTGIEFQGNATANLNCGVASNATSNESIDKSGSANVVATPIVANGLIDGNYPSGTVLRPNYGTQPNPFAALPDPTALDVSACQPQYKVNANQSRRLTGGGCWRGMDIKGDLILDPGTYFIAGDAFTVGSQATVTVSAPGVTIVLTSETPSDASTFADLRINAGAILNMMSPTEGTYKGILFSRDSRAPSASIVINGNAASTLEGASYFPNDDLTYNGTSGMTTNCLQLIARTIKITGNATINNSCTPTNGGGGAFNLYKVRLVS